MGAKTDHEGGGVDDDVEGMYPSVRKALSQNGLVANLRCAVKLALWHGSYVLLTVIGVLLLALVTVAKKTANSVENSWLDDKIMAFGDWIFGVGKKLDESGAREAATKVVEAIFAVAVVVSVVIAAVGAIWIVYQHPIMVAQSLAIAVVFMLTVAGIVAFDDRYGATDAVVTKTKSAAGTARKKAVDTPGVRRVYGKCPVNFDIEPKWFRKVSEKFEE